MDILGTEKDELNALEMWGLHEYIFRCFVEELHIMMEKGEVTGLTMDLVDLFFIKNFAVELTKYLIDIQFTIVEAICNFWDGKLNERLKPELRAKAAGIPENLNRKVFLCSKHKVVFAMLLFLIVDVHLYARCS